MPRLTAQISRKSGELRIELPECGVYFWVALASAADTADASEDCRPGEVSVSDTGDGWQAEVAWHSSIWKEKRHFYRYSRGRLEHWIELRGKGRLAHLTYLSGTVEGADTVYGVSMGSEGVSEVVSLKLAGKEVVTS